LSTGVSGFYWLDGSPLNFANWDVGEPNNANGGEHCVEVSASSSKKKNWLNKFFINHNIIVFSFQSSLEVCLISLIKSM
jgi:hypothetical protein